MRSVDTTPLLTGSCKHPQRMSIKDGTLAPVDFPATAILIRHPEEGPILFDTGYDPAFMAATTPFPERLYRWATPVEHPTGADAASQCTRLGVAPSDVRHIVISHFHGDHIAGLHAFPNATLHCAKAGLGDAYSGSRFARVRRGILPALLPQDMGDRAAFFEEAASATLPSDLHPFTEGRDILRDGSLIAIPLPGHCPGHWGLLVNDDQYGLHFLVADAAWSLDAIRRNIPPPNVAANWLGRADHAQQTLRALHDLYRRNQDIRLTPCHCPERAAEATP